MLVEKNEPIYVTSPLLPDVQRMHHQISEIWESKWLTNNGGKHQKLEAVLKEYLNVEYLSLFSNGTLALLLGLKALNLTGEVITTPFTFPATVQVLDWNGLTPVFCDINPVTLNIDASKIEALITERTSAILGVHVFGNPCEVEIIERIADKYSLKVIYDGAHVFGTKYKGQPIGSFGDMTMFSFHATKLFNTIEGGAIICKDAEINRKVQLLKNFGLAGPEEVVLSGINAKMNEIQAAVGLEVLPLVSQERQKREHIRQVYVSCLRNIPGVNVVTNLMGEESSYQYFVITIDEVEYGRSRDWVYEELQKYNVFTRRYFSPLCSEFEWYQHLDSAKATHLPRAHKTVQEVLSMPYYGELAIETAHEICDLLKNFHLEAMKENRVLNV